MILTPDTNLLVYVHDARDPTRQRLAREIYTRLATDGEHRIALQVMGELYAVLTRKLRQERTIARDAVETMSVTFEPYGYDASDVHNALALAAAGVLSYWDALLIGAASRAGCDALISEDMQDGFRHGSIEIVTPFDGEEINPRLLSLLG